MISARNSPRLVGVDCGRTASENDQPLPSARMVASAASASWMARDTSAGVVGRNSTRVKSCPVAKVSVSSMIP